MTNFLFSIVVTLVTNCTTNVTAYEPQTYDMGVIGIALHRPRVATEKTITDELTAITNAVLATAQTIEMGRATLYRRTRILRRDLIETWNEVPPPTPKPTDSISWSTNQIITNMSLWRWIGPPTNKPAMSNALLAPNRLKTTNP